MKELDRVQIAAATAADEYFLWLMLTYAAAMGRGGHDQVERARADPYLSTYVSGWGTQAGDGGVIARDSQGDPIGAAWLRLIHLDSPWKVADQASPELAMAVLPQARGRGVGTALLQGLLALAAASHRRITLSVRAENSARRFYTRLGFVETATIRNRVGGDSIVMRLNLPPKPAAIGAILSESRALGFAMISEPGVGSLLAVLAAAKPGGRLLELGTGSGHGTACLLAGMDASARLDTVDTDARLVAVAQRHLGADPRVRFHLMDGGEYLEQASHDGYDLIFADAWPGKFTHLDMALSLLRPGGLYIVDDLLPQPTWPAGHAPNVAALLRDLAGRSGFASMRLAWASGLLVVVRLLR